VIGEQDSALVKHYRVVGVLMCVDPDHDRWLRRSCKCGHLEMSPSLF
jgi:hypothetical protein